MPATRTPSSARERIHLWWDLFIIVLVIANLALLLFDSLFLIPPLNTAFEAVAPGLHAAYEQNIHANFLSIDLAFVAVFLLDVLAGWAVAIAERRYHRWFFYPFVHWYDVLGCIPLSGFRLLRVLRVVSLLFRLQRLELIDVRQWYVYRVAAKYLDILLEELTDRISLRMLDNVQQQLRDSDDLSSSVIERVVEPRKQALIQEISQRLETMAGDVYTQNRDDTLRYVRGLVSRTLAESPELQRVSRLPMGTQLTKGLESSLSDLACHLVDEALVGLRSKEFSALVGHLAESGFDAWSRTDPRTEQITEQVLIDMLELLKERIAVKSWHQKYQ
ncbi:MULTISPECIES: ion transporter [unclassified Cobetia]|uniref:ion transporter n=1 Tax=unclassified Cobetia TaxID=2609414 RepID=UPI0020980CBB|nr:MULTISPECIES: ion transporter [unclassified Cobetia]MCO7231747.1 ion transporter [Cobetia sp. Dlab-2-AX]MCO7234937.1 ion transporter [Cobetia sp. Dlab-2-U]